MHIVARTGRHPGFLATNQLSGTRLDGIKNVVWSILIAVVLLACDWHPAIPVPVMKAKKIISFGTANERQSTLI